jgi:DNA-binding LytR/AlgR family response regulator
MIKAVAIDDELIALKVIENYCKEIGIINIEKTFSNAQEGLKHLNKFPTDLVFLDIDMPEINGIDLYKQLKQNTVVVFITSRPDYAVEGFTLNALDYLLKPFTFDRFKQACEKAREYFAQFSETQKTTEYIFVRADYSLQKIKLSDILYIEALDDYLKIYINQQKTIVARMTMKALIEKLPAAEFVRVHRSYIVPLKKVESIRNKTLQIGSKQIPLGNSYEADVLKHFSS